jgi:tetratricopeptide (TPR) repeat protein
MQRFFHHRLLVLLIIGIAPAQSAPASSDETPTKSSADNPEITVTGSVPHAEAPLPKLREDEFTDCFAQGPRGIEILDPLQLVLCTQKRNAEMHAVIQACVDPDGKTALPRVIQACTELLDRKLFTGRDRFPMFVNRARAYFAQGDKERALADYDEAVRVAPYNAKAYYSRGAYYAVQSDGDAALRDFDAALRLDRKAVPALRLRAKLYDARGNFDGALADYSEAIHLQQKSATLWSERGYVRLRQRDNERAMQDEAHAIELDPKLARAYFYRGAAFGGLGDSAKAVRNLQKAVDLDPSLDRYVTSRGKTASLTLPPI